MVNSGKNLQAAEHHRDARSVRAMSALREAIAHGRHCQ